MIVRRRSFGLVVAVASAAIAPLLVNCAAPDESEDEESEDAITDVNDELG